MNRPAPSLFQGRQFSKWVKLGVPSLGIFLFWLLHHEVPILFNSLMISVGLYYVLNPLVDFMESHFIRRGLASFLVLIGFITIMYMIWLRFLTFSSDLGAKDLDSFQGNLKSTAQKIEEWLHKEVKTRVPALKRLIEPQTKVISAAEEGIKTSSIKKSQKDKSHLKEAPPEESLTSTPFSERILGVLGKWIMEHALDFAKTLLGLLPNLILIPYFTFFFLKDGRSFRKNLIEWIPNRYFEPSLKFFYEMDRRMHAYLQSMLLDCFLVGLLVGMGSYFVRAPYPIVFGCIAFLLNSIPLLGPLIYGVVCLIITIGAGSSTEVVLGFLMVFLLSRLCDDFIFAPTVYGRSHQLHPVIVICAILLGETVAGAWGMFLAIPIISTILLGISILREISVGEDALTIPHSLALPFG